MNRALRTLTAAAVATGGAIGVAGAAAATPVPPGCEDPGEGYVPGGVCQLVVEVVPLCENDIPLLSYRAELEGGVTPEGLTISWANPGGQDVVLTDQPLAGTVRWPGVTVDENGNPTGWPGWVQLDNGDWVEGGDFAWARPEVEVSFEINPDAVVTLSYPPATPQCTPGPVVQSVGSGSQVTPEPVVEGEVSETSATPAPTAEVQTEAGVLGHSVLARTGASVAPFLGAAGGLVIGGLVVLALGRRRRGAEG